jgi:hypothetical protein
VPRVRDFVARLRRRPPSGPEIVYAPERDGDPDPDEVRREGAALRRDRFDAVAVQVRRLNRWIP